MHSILFHGKTFIIREGETIRTAMLRNGFSPHNGHSRWLNCKGLGTCGTCAVHVDGEASPLNRLERWRLGFPPHNHQPGLRLACQCVLHSDAKVHKGAGFWGQS